MADWIGVDMPDGTCMVPDCYETVDSRGWCKPHYDQWRRWGDVDGIPLGRPTKLCEIEGCGRKHSAKGLCKIHYMREYCQANREHRLARYYGNPDRLKDARASNLKANYGITQAQYDAMLAEQEGLCALCQSTGNSTRRLAVDHDHKKGKDQGASLPYVQQGIGHVARRSGITPERHRLSRQPRCRLSRADHLVAAPPVPLRPAPASFGFDEALASSRPRSCPGAAL